MDPLTIAAAGGIRSRLQSLDLLANNLANAATSGYKTDREFYGIYASQDAQDANSGAGLTSLPLVESQWTDFSPGVLQTTGNPLDVALSGKGFLTVNGPNGPLYTRNGSLQIQASGDLATAEGYTLTAAGGGTIRVASGKPIEISTDGTVVQGGQSIGQLEIVDFPSTGSLKKMGNTCFQNVDPKNAPTAPSKVEVQQGKIENSNVPVAESAMRLVGVMRQFEMLQKAIAISGEMSNHEIARLPG
jgi:flagellar basal-body rod protein FlgF